MDDKQEDIYKFSNNVLQGIDVNLYAMFPSDIKPFIHALNVCVEKRLPEKQHVSLTLDMLYCISTRFPVLAPHMIISKELKRKVSVPMRTAVNPTIFNHAVNSFLFGNTWVKGATLLGIAGLSGFLWYQYRRNMPTSPMPSPQKLSYPSAAYRKITSTPQHSGRK